MYADLSTIRNLGFSGFISVEQLRKDYSVIPNEKGVYFILNPDCRFKSFLKIGSGGFFKGKNPNVSLEDLEARWVPQCHLLYIGKAGGGTSAATLRKRLKQYLDFGMGKPIGHWGGRYIWQLSNSTSLLVAWKIITDGDPIEKESRLIKEFHDHYGKLPFTNLRF